MCFKVNRVFGAVWCDRPRGRTWGTNPALVSAGTRLGGGALVPGRAKLSRKVWAGEELSEVLKALGPPGRFRDLGRPAAAPWGLVPGSAQVTLAFPPRNR